MKRYGPTLATLYLLLCAATIGAQTPPRPAATSITPNWQNTEIAVIAESVGDITGVEYIVSPQVRGQMTFRSARPMSRQELNYAFQNILSVYGFAAVPAGGNKMKIVPEQNARYLPGNDLPANLNNLGSDEMVTTVMEIKNLNALQISTTLRQMLGPTGAMISLPGTNSIIVTDRAGTVAKIQKILTRVDQAGNSSLDRIPLENAVAADVARIVTQLSAGQPTDAATGTAIRVLADDRTNSVIVSGDPTQRLRIADLVDSLDEPSTSGGGTRVITLKYAAAETLAATLKAQITGVAATTGTTATGGAAGGTANSAAAVADRSVVIQADKETNKLIITAPPRTMLALLNLIDELDIAQPQVHIEAIVAEITDRKAADLGVNWAIFSNEENANIPISGFVSDVGGASIADLAGVVGDATSAVSNGLIPTGATFAVGRLRDNGLNLAAMFRALRTEGNNNIVSLPNVTARNNQEAEMKSGQKVPFVNSQYAGSTGNTGNNAFNPLTNVQRQDVGTTLTVTPHIIPGTDEVILDINLVSSSLSSERGDANSLITNERSVKTSVRVRTGTTIVIGGMISNDSGSSETRVPLLSKIPVLGELFRTRNGSHEKKNLTIFIQPRILADAIQANAETTARANQIREMQQTQNAKRELIPLLPKDTPPQIPDWAPPPPAVTPTQPSSPARP